MLSPQKRGLSFGSPLCRFYCSVDSVAPKGLIAIRRSKHVWPGSASVLFDGLRTENRAIVITGEFRLYIKRAGSGRRSFIRIDRQSFAGHDRVGNTDFGSHGGRLRHGQSACNVNWLLAGLRDGSGRPVNADHTPFGIRNIVAGSVAKWRAIRRLHGGGIVRIHRRERSGHRGGKNRRHTEVSLLTTAVVTNVGVTRRVRESGNFRVAWNVPGGRELRRGIVVRLDRAKLRKVAGVTSG